jgi:hypothetical protein
VKARAAYKEKAEGRRQMAEGKKNFSDGYIA